MDSITTDTRAIIAYGCPMTIDPHEADQCIDVVIGHNHGTGPAIRLVLSDIETCDTLANVATAARNAFLDMFPEQGVINVG